MSDIVVAARKYLEPETPFVHQGREKGVGIDCWGISGNVARECKKIDFDITVYSRTPTEALMTKTLRKYMDQIALSEAQPGNVLHFSFKKFGQHIAFVTEVDPIYMLHAYAPAGKVVEHIMDKTWEWRLKGVYRFRDD